MEEGGRLENHRFAPANNRCQSQCSKELTAISCDQLTDPQISTDKLPVLVSKRKITHYSSSRTDQRLVNLHRQIAGESQLTPVNKG
ncbi:hypothetical protein HAX54_018288, partial [Datura stramonium]|nr:hypothetical protein [Datura stramonium]